MWLGSFPQFMKFNSFIETLRARKAAVNQILLDRSQRTAYRRIDAEDERRIEFYSQFIKKGDLVFDVGANLGNRTKAFLALGAQVIAFEPQPLCADFLEAMLKGEPGFKLVRKALGATECQSEMLLSDTHVLSSLSPAWIKATSSSGRFASVKWDRRAVVSITTLDQALHEFGLPSFVKIDVEGYEAEVLSGLSKPVPCVSIEFTGEYLENTFRAIDHLASLGPIEGQVSLAESLTFSFETWLPAPLLKPRLSLFGEGWAGDVYLRVST